MQKKRINTLLSLIALNDNLNDIEKNLSSLSWDSEKDLVTLTRKDIVNVLEKYLKGQINEYQLEKWAELIEGREDIGVESKFHDYIKDAIFALANPLLSFPDGHINKKIALKLIDRNPLLHNN